MTLKVSDGQYDRLS